MNRAPLGGRHTSLLASLANQASSALTTGTAPGRLGNRHPSIAPYETLRCADRPIAVAVGNDEQFRRLTGVLGIPRVSDDPRFRTNADRVGHRDELETVLEAALALAMAAEWEERLLAAGLVASVAGDILDGIRRAESLGLDPIAHVGEGYAPQVRHPIRYSVSRVVEPSPPPVLGEHSAVMRDWLAGPADVPPSAGASGRGSEEIAAGTAVPLTRT